MVAFETLLFSTPFPEFRRPNRSHGWSRLAAPTARRGVLHMHGRLAQARSCSYRLGARTSVRPPSYAREVRWAERRTLAQACYCRRPLDPCAHRCYYFSCARNMRGQCCVRMPRLGVRGATSPMRSTGRNRRARRPLAPSPSRFERSRASLDLLQTPTAPVAPPIMWALSQARAMLQVRRAAPIW